MTQFVNQFNIPRAPGQQCFPYPRLTDWNEASLLNAQNNILNTKVEKKLGYTKDTLNIQSAGKIWHAGARFDKDSYPNLPKLTNWFQNDINLAAGNLLENQMIKNSLIQQYLKLGNIDTAEWLLGRNLTATEKANLLVDFNLGKIRPVVTPILKPHVVVGKPNTSEDDLKSAIKETYGRVPSKIRRIKQAIRLGFDNSVRVKSDGPSTPLVISSTSANIPTQVKDEIAIENAALAMRANLSAKKIQRRFREHSINKAIKREEMPHYHDEPLPPLEEVLVSTPKPASDIEFLETLIPKIKSSKTGSLPTGLKLKDFKAKLVELGFDKGDKYNALQTIKKLISVMQSKQEGKGLVMMKSDGKLKKRFSLLTGMQEAGNNSKKVSNEIGQIIQEMYSRKKITGAMCKKLIKRYVINV